MRSRSHQDVIATFESALDQLPDGASYLRLEDIGQDPDGEKPTMLAEVAQALGRAVADVNAPGLENHARVAVTIDVSEKGDNLVLVHKVTYTPPKYSQRTTHATKTKRWAAIQGELALDDGASKLPGVDGDEASRANGARREPVSPASPRRRGRSAEDASESSPQ